MGKCIKREIRNYFLLLDINYKYICIQLYIEESQTHLFIYYSFSSCYSIRFKKFFALMTRLDKAFKTPMTRKYYVVGLYLLYRV